MSKSNINDNNDWFRDGQPTSYKIQVSYIEIPKHLKLEEKVVDTPYRFESFEEAKLAAHDLFKGYSYNIVGSNDQVHWQIAPTGQLKSKEVKDESWYSIYGVKPSYRTDYNSDTFNKLKNLRNPLWKPATAQQTTEVSTKPDIANSKQ